MTECYGCKFLEFSPEDIEENCPFHPPLVVLWGMHKGTLRPFCHEDCMSETQGEPDGSLYCGGCREVCRAGIMDFGIGSYEYWGACGVDVQLAVVSRCCEVEVYKTPDFRTTYTMSEHNEQEAYGW